MNIFSKIFSFFKRRNSAKKIKNYIAQINRQLLVFKTIEQDFQIKDCVKNIVNIEKYEELQKDYNLLLTRIEKHNINIEDLKNTFNEILENNAIDEIVLNIDNYTLEKLSKFNDIAIKIAEFKIPDEFEFKKEYLAYIIDIGDVVNNYDLIVEQNSLLTEFKKKIKSLGDKYYDARESNTIFKNLKALLDSITSYKKLYYKIPRLDEKLIEKHNENFIEKHLKDEIFDNINDKSLDQDQRKSILCDSRSNLTIAGAGAGKTLTICGKVKWLIEKNNIKPDDILLLSYSKASAEDLNKKVSKVANGLTVKTFHSLGLDILNKVNGVKKAIEEQFKAYINKFFEEELIKDIKTASAIFNFYTLYLYTNRVDEKQYNDDGERFEDLKKADYKTLKDRLSQGKEKHETMQKEFVKSYEELVLANWLFINGIKYEYERSYEIQTSTPDKRQYTPDFYLSDYNIYLEHYGVNKEGRTPQYPPDQEREYLDGIEWKRRTHEENQTICLETFSYEFTDGTVFDNLKNKLEEQGVKIQPLSEEEIYNSINTIFLGQEFTSLFNLILTFLSLYKAQYPDNKGFDDLKNKTFFCEYERKRAVEFLNICKGIYDYYINEIRNQDKIDFDDMILQSIVALDKTDKYKYKYIIVDEFQDISQSRRKFLEKLIEHGDSKLYAVGDDWQAIYRFAGCDVNIFLGFESIFEDSKINKITSTHRNSAELQAIVEPFITANPEQYKKHIKSNKHQDRPIRIIYHKSDREGAFRKALENIYRENKNAEILVLGRNRHDVDCIISNDIQVKNYDEIICSKYPTMKLTYRTVHQSKGLESDYVILISGEDARNGFPNKMEDDRLLLLVLGSESSFEFAEERRLFYVALTRTRSIVYVLSDRINTSIFVEEIEERCSIENPELVKRDDLKKFLCPYCKSGSLVIRESSEEKRAFYACSNYPYCNYTINDLKAVLINNRCPDCGDFLVLRNGPNGKFIGCHNYPRCRHTKQINKMPETHFGFYK